METTVNRTEMFKTAMCMSYVMCMLCCAYPSERFSGHI